MGLPTPNLFAGEHNFHSRLEWVSVQDMEKAVEDHRPPVSGLGGKDAVFIGHFAVGLALKRVAPRTSLGSSGGRAATRRSVVAHLPDSGLGARAHRTRQHGVHTAGIRQLPRVAQPADARRLGRCVCLAGRPARARRVMGWIVAAVVSHWLLDVVTHGPTCRCCLSAAQSSDSDCGTRYQRRCSSRASCSSQRFALYARTTRAKDGIGRWGFVTWVVMLVAIYVGSIFGPPTARRANPEVGRLRHLDVSTLGVVVRRHAPHFGLTVRART